ncbi:ATP-dependent helicase [Desulfogranum mediterraneum]|uniref:ATP-dependent helicase n=1 Tax=Desulfogranum mediterraneum TaxID=160661 RepID=UPI00048ADD5F|nr:ATP-dependent helicase [Desulfogranum mediterraneum]
MHNQDTIYTDPNQPLNDSSPADAHSLNSAQHAAVHHGAGPVLVIAGAGSGKTRTLVYRMAHLLRQGVPPESILLLTFTRRAAQEMLWRAGQLTDQSSARIVGGTFHATANLLLRRYGHHLGFGSRFTIIDRGDAEGIINLIKSSLGMSGAGKRFPSKRVIMNLISGSINKSRTIDDLVLEGHVHLSEFIEDFHAINKHYQQFKEDHALMDYDDLLVNWQRLISESKEAHEAICSRFEHVLVDEYQDTNLIQAHIIRRLASIHGNVMVVGDDAQSIYSFRGADFHNIMRFSEQFPGTSIIKLEENYRSTQPILELTNAVIASAEEKFTKTLFSSIEGGIRPTVFKARNEAAEARYIATTIKKLQEEGTPINEIAILFRSGFHSYKLEMELASHYYEFEKRGGIRLTESAHIKDILSFFRILVNPWDTLSWNRLLLQLDKVGPKTAQKIINFIKQADDPIARLADYPPGKTWKAGFDELVAILREISRPQLPPSTIYDLVSQYYLPIFEKIYYDDYPKRRKELDQISSLIGGYGDLQSFVDDTALDPPEPESKGGGEEQSGKLILSTIHSSKGLEWDAVFVIGLAEGRFPHQHAGSGEQWEEERRLLYVAATRAKKQLFLTYPCELMTPDRKHHRTGMSPFLRELPHGLYIQEQAPSPYGVQETHAPQGAAPKPSHQKVQSARQTFAPGMIVHHGYFGNGRITSIPGPRRVEVAFDRHGTKILHLDYANLSVMDSRQAS